MVQSTRLLARVLLLMMLLERLQRRLSLLDTSVSLEVH
jgi:hypothetical protein